MGFNWAQLQADLAGVKDVYHAVVTLVEKIAADLKKEIAASPPSAANTIQEMHNEAKKLAESVVKNTSAEHDKKSEESSSGGKSSTESRGASGGGSSSSDTHRGASGGHTGPTSSKR